MHANIWAARYLTYLYNIHRKSTCAIRPIRLSTFSICLPAFHPNSTRACARAHVRNPSRPPFMSSSPPVTYRLPAEHYACVSLGFFVGTLCFFCPATPFYLFSSFVFYFFTSLFYVPLFVSLLLVFLTSNIHLPITLLPILLTLPSPILHLTQTLFRSPFLRYALGLR